MAFPYFLGFLHPFHSISLRCINDDEVWIPFPKQTDTSDFAWISNRFCLIGRRQSIQVGVRILILAQEEHFDFFHWSSFPGPHQPTRGTTSWDEDSAFNPLCPLKQGRCQVKNCSYSSIRLFISFFKSTFSIHLCTHLDTI